jgi:uncharacterized protein YndB with AHSA1/START domain
VRRTPSRKLPLPLTTTGYPVTHPFRLIPNNGWMTPVRYALNRDNMPRLFVDRAIEIDALPSKVWNVLTKAGYTSQWAPEFYGGASFGIESSWRKGASVLWKDEQGQTIVEGEVTRLEPDKILRFTVFDARAPERPATTEEDGITFELAQRGDHTLLKLRQGDFSAMPDGEKYRQMSEDVWDRVLPRIKRLAEEPTP